VIGPLTLNVLDQALGQARAWRERGIDLPMSVNLSPRLLEDASLPGQIERCLAAHGVPPQRLTLEVTETSMIHSPRRTTRTLQELSETGARVSIDDFGTGYSSLTYLREFPIDEIKIDRLFVDAIRSEGPDASIIRSIVELGRGFQVRVIAEGIEDETTLARLRELGCLAGQGFWLCPPLAAEALEAWVRARRGASVRLPAA
jgi:EAL domain-containing protein (putative c-di-GMP-specific phosphodiesterase class I)